MKYTILLLLLAVIAVSCQEAETTEETPTETQIKEQETTPEVETEVHQTNVVTPEFWNSYETDVLIVFYYSKIESSPDAVHSFKEELLNGDEQYGYEFHEYHTDENMGMVQVDDNIFFNLTEYLWNNEEGFVLLKKGELLHIPSGELTADTYSDQVVPFFSL